jgi:predicted transcriptional regulator
LRNFFFVVSCVESCSNEVTNAFHDKGNAQLEPFLVFFRDDERRLKKLAKHIQPISRKNWDLEKEIEELDEQIGNNVRIFLLAT